MSAKYHLITGATGLLGSNIAAELIERGEHVAALVRSDSQIGYVKSLGVETLIGDLRNPASLRRAFAGADIVYHCAAKVGDWGPWSEFEALTIDGTRNVIQACEDAGVKRLLHVSAISVYGIIKDSSRPVVETDPLGQRLPRRDYYARAKITAEKETQQFPRHTIIRPPWLCGSRDRATIGRVVKALRAGRVRLIGRGDNPLSVLHAADVARGAILAANDPESEGEIYNLSSDHGITQKQLLDVITEHLSLPPITRHVPYFLADRIAFLGEALARLLHRRTPPALTRRAVFLIGRCASFSSAKARSRLGWTPQVDIGEGIREALEWYLECEAVAPQKAD
jgi:nucleoside-diphosphate-sugar epimerase